MTSDDAKIKQYIQEFLRNNRRWLTRQDLIAQRRKLVVEAKRLHDAGKLKQAATKLRQAERIHARLVDQLAAPTARKAPRAPRGTSSSAQSSKRKKSSRSAPKPSGR